MKRKIYVTGSAGFVGSHLIPFLIKNNFKVTAHVKTKKEAMLIPKQCAIVVGDLSKKDSWQKKVKGHDIIIHLAAQISSYDFQTFNKNNVQSTQNLIRNAKRYKVKKIILFSSAAVTSIRKDWYAQTKQEQEEIVKKSGIDYQIIRPSMIYGPGDTKNIGWLIEVLKKTPVIPLPGFGKFGRQPIYIDDICNIIIKLIDRTFQQKIFEIHGFEYITMEKMVEVITKNLNQFKIIFPVPLFCIYIPFWIQEKLFVSPKFTHDQIKSLVSGEKFKGDKWWSLFDIIPTKFEAGVSKMISKH